MLKIKRMFRNKDLVKSSKDGSQDDPINFDTTEWHAMNRIRVCLANISQIDVKRETLWRISTHILCDVTCTRAHVLLQLTEAAASKYTYVTVHDNESFTRCAGACHVRYDFKLAWLGDRSKGKERLIRFIRGFHAAKTIQTETLKQRFIVAAYILMHIYRETHCSFLIDTTRRHAL